MRNRTIRRRSRRPVVAVVAATATAILGTAVVPQPTAEAAPAAALTASPPPTPEETASKQAKETGKRVEVLARRTETSQLFANPSGGYTEDQYVLPRWTRKDNRLVPIDTVLAPTGDGRISPKATMAGLSFSGGGTGPAVSIIHDGRKLSLSWPAPLPKPTTDGDTATYAEVLPGVDLTLRAGNVGFGQLLVVKTPEAATNPALKTIRLSMTTDGVAVSADSYGNLTAVDAAGQEVFTAPTPRMWDSSTSTGLGRALLASDTPAPPADKFEPGHGAKEADLGLSVGKSSMTLTPHQPLLTGDDTAYPVYIDPTFAVPGTREAWAIAYKRTPNTAYFNGAGWHNADGSVGTNTARVGYENVTDGLARSFFRMDSNNLWNTKKLIKKSTFRIENTWSWSCEDRRTELWFTGGISTSTTWASQDNSTMWARKLSHSDTSRGWGGSCPAGNLAFDVTSAANEAVTRKLNNITLGLRATNENDVYAWKKFDAGTATLSTDYNTYPMGPSSLDTTPDTYTDACLAGPYLYKTIGNTDISLSGTFTDPDGGTVKARFVLWPQGHGGPTNEVNQVVDVPSGRGAKLPILKTKLKDLLTDAGKGGSGNLSWRARAEDGELVGPWSPVCTFAFDATRPSFPPSVTSTQFPDGSEGWPETTGMARSEGTFQLQNKDTNPAAAFEYWTDWDPTVRRDDLGFMGGSIADIKLTPPSVGRHSLSVRSIDLGGNISDTTRYWFYANGTGKQDKPGDLNGDGIADFYGVRTDGDLWFYSGHGNGYVAPSTLASTQNFTGAAITRRGDWTQDGYEDLVALNAGTGGKTLTVHPNNGFGYACSARNEQADGVSKACQYDEIRLSVFNPVNNRWANATEILAIGDVDGPLDTNSDGVVDVPGHPDLLVKEGGRLWLYFGSADHRLDSNKDPVLVGTGGWSGFSLAAAGDRDKDGDVDLIARDSSNGELRFYPGTPNGTGLGNGNTSTVIGTAWTTTNRPLFTAVPDANGDGTSDIWSTSGDGRLYFYPNALGAGTVVGTGGWSSFQDLS
ncbi:FG-GAP-like repeat-containing protein [Streptomyces sp. NPDC016459]|uniref:FG-GAP repeat domain-containing protein n=1 Tax=Streptomyces sp. NPDC016459 TaxID=3157190 RepID=UPI0033EA9F69